MRTQVELLISRHGAEAYDIMNEGRDILSALLGSFGPSDTSGKLGCSVASGDARVLATEFDAVWSLEARHAIRQTMCMNLIDYYVRRSPLFLAREDHGLSQVGRISQIFARDLNWSDARREEEVSALRDYIGRELAWKTAQGTGS